MAKAKKIFKIIVDILTFLVFLVLAVVIYAKVKSMVSNKDYPEFFGYSIFRVDTGSMEPTISQNDIIIIKKSNEYEIDDIVTFKTDDDYITHRIVTKIGEKIITKGDANNARDVAIEKKDIIGKVVSIKKKLGVWQKVLTNPIIIIMIFVTLILFDFAFSYKGIVKKQNTKMVNKIKDISLEEVNKNSDSPKMSDKEIVELYKKTNKVQNGEEVKFDKKEKEFLNYTIRLDLNELKKQINSNVKEKDE